MSGNRERKPPPGNPPSKRISVSPPKSTSSMLVILGLDTEKRAAILSDTQIDWEAIHWGDIPNMPSSRIRESIALVERLSDRIINHDDRESHLRNHASIIRELRGFLGHAIAHERASFDSRFGERTEYIQDEIYWDVAERDPNFEFYDLADFRHGDRILAYFDRNHLVHEEEPSIAIPHFHYIKEIDLLDQTKIEFLLSEHPKWIVDLAREQARYRYDRAQEKNAFTDVFDHSIVFYIESVAGMKGVAPLAYLRDMLLTRLREDYQACLDSRPESTTPDPLTPGW